MIRLLTLIIQFYQKVLSPLKPKLCRFYPTCSEYAIQSFQNKGLFKGGYLAFKRICRCHPFHPGGCDPLT
ncbi:MAG: membrane protein insertion efficiency factor YidD [Deltaproteobacteria bacterium]|nr:membrane protein insertion efficiency factor YidD [Deltaproteobacteria bacterium]